MSEPQAEPQAAPQAAPQVQGAAPAAGEGELQPPQHWTDQPLPEVGINVLLMAERPFPVTRGGVTSC